MTSHGVPFRPAASGAATPLPAEPLLRPLLADALTWLGAGLALLCVAVWMLALVGRVEDRRVLQVAGFSAILFGALLTMAAATLVLVGADPLDEAVWLFLGVFALGLGVALRRRAWPPRMREP